MFLSVWCIGLPDTTKHASGLELPIKVSKLFEPLFSLVCLFFYKEPVHMLIVNLWHNTLENLLLNEDQVLQGCLLFHICGISIEYLYAILSLRNEV